MPVARTALPIMALGMPPIDASAGVAAVQWLGYGYGLLVGGAMTVTAVSIAIVQLGGAVANLAVRCTKELEYALWRCFRSR